MSYWIEYWDRDPISFVIIWLGIAAILAIVLANLRRPKHILGNLGRTIDRLASLLNTVAAAWIMVMAWMILVDVVALMMNIPLEGVTETVGNSVIAILFMQIPLAIRKGGMIRTTIFYDNAGPKYRSVIDGIAYVLGMIFFTSIALGGWHNMVSGFVNQELQIVGRGTLPLWPYRYFPVWFSVLATIIYALMFIDLFTKTEQERRDAEAEGPLEGPLEGPAS